MKRQSPPNELATREAFFQREQIAWKALIRMWSSLPQSALLEPGASGPGWTIKDVINHIATWQGAGLRAINDLQAGRWARLAANTDSFNHQHYLEDRNNLLAESQRRLRSARSRLLRKLRLIPDAELLNEFGRQAIGWWAKWTTYAHYEEHIGGLQEFGTRWLSKRDA